MAKNLALVLATIRETPWAILPAYGQTVYSILERRAVHGIKLTDDEVADLIGDKKAAVEARRAEAEEFNQNRSGPVIVPVYGVITPRGNFLQSSGATSVEGLTTIFKQLEADPAVSEIILDIDSPGGSVQGVDEFAEVIANSSKKVIAVANHMIASAAYWIASAADEIWATPSAVVGSIGVYTMHQDLSAMAEKEGVKVTYIHAGARKVDGNPFQPLTATAADQMQKEINYYYNMFTGRVAAGRGVSVPTVQGPLWGEGTALNALDALEVGMIDKIGTLEDAVYASLNQVRSRNRARADLELRERELGL